MLMMIFTACVITIIALVFTIFTLNNGISNTKSKTIAMVAIALVVCISYLFLHPRCQMIVFETSMIEGDIKIDDIVMISDGRDLYIPKGITIKNISEKNIESVKLFVKKHDEVILDLILGMDGTKEYRFDQDRHVYHVGFKKTDELIIDLTYVIDGVEKHTKAIWNVSEYSK